MAKVVWASEPIRRDIVILTRRPWRHSRQPDDLKLGPIPGQERGHGRLFPAYRSRRGLAAVDTGHGRKL